MKYLFDASSIYSVIVQPKTELLIQNYTCDLVRYEIGNILLTERFKEKNHKWPATGIDVGKDQKRIRLYGFFNCEGL